jgi:hypothetical protein
MVTSRRRRRVRVEKEFEQNMCILVSHPTLTVSFSNYPHGAYADNVSSVSSPPVEAHPENAWMLSLKNEWRSPPLCHLPRSKDGDDILDALLRFVTPIPSYDRLLEHAELYGGDGPSIEHVVADLIHTDEEEMVIVDQSVGQGVSASKEQVLASMWRSAHAKTDDSEIKLFSIPDLPFHKNGTGKCLIQLPNRFLDKAVVDSDNGKDTWSTTFCPPGTITDIHWDYHGGAQVMLGISTRKLWLFWPPSQKNLEWWKRRNLLPTKSSDTLEAIQVLEGLKVLYQTGRQAFFMPPFHFHAVLTFEVSAHCGTPIWDYDHWKHTARRVTEWEYLWGRDYFQNGCVREDARLTMEHLNHAMSRWDKLGKRLAKRKCVSKVDLQEFVDWVKVYRRNVEQRLAQLK